MHGNNRKWLKDLAKEYPQFFNDCRVLELGSYAVGGDTIRPFFRNCEYTGIDKTPGPTVDIVGDVKSQEFQEGYYDTIACFSMLEHDLAWRESLSNALPALRVGGMLFMCWGAEGNTPHMDVWQIVPYQEVLDFLPEHGIEILDAFFEEEKYGEEIRGAYDLAGIKIK